MIGAKKMKKMEIVIQEETAKTGGEIEMAVPEIE